MNKNNEKPTICQSIPKTSLDYLESKLIGLCIQNRKEEVPVTPLSMVPESFFGSAPASDEGGGGGGSEKKGLTLISCPFQIATHGIDTVHLTYDLDIQNSGLLARIIESKKCLQSTTDNEVVFKFLENGSDSFQWNLQRQGWAKYPYVFRTGDLILCLSSRKIGSIIPNAALMIGSLTCNQDVKATLNTFKFWLSCIDVFVVTENVSRIDPFADMIHDIKNSRIEKVRHYITRARDTHLFYSHRKFTGIQWGNGDILCRMYDKQLQMKQQGQIEKMMFFNTLWNTSDKTPITRIEFQLRRKAIKEFYEKPGQPASTTLDDILSKLPELWKYLTEEWLRHCKNFVDLENNHQSRSEISFFWSNVQKAFEYVKVAIVRNRSQKHINIPALRAQACGILTTIAAGLGIAPDFFAIVSEVSKIVAQDICAAVALPSFGGKFGAKANLAVVSF